MKTERYENSASVCRRYRRKTDAYISDTLSPADRAEYDSHLNSCESCRRYTREMGELSRAVAGSAEDLPDGLHERVMAALASECRKSRSSTHEHAARAARSLRAAAVGFAAVFCVCFLIGAMLVMPMMSRMDRTNSSGPYYGGIDNSINIAGEINQISQAPSLDIAGSLASPDKCSEDVTEKQTTEEIIPSGNTTASGEKTQSNNTDIVGCDTTYAAVTVTQGTDGSEAENRTTAAPTVGYTDNRTDTVTDVIKVSDSNGTEYGTVVIICAVLTVGSLCAFIVTLIELKRINKRSAAAGDRQKSSQTDISNKTEDDK